MKWILIAILILACCGDVPSKLQPEPKDGLKDGYWETMCGCQLRMYPIDREEGYSSRCASGWKKAQVCPNETPIWCSTGPHWGYRCVENPNS